MSSGNNDNNSKAAATCLVIAGPSGVGKGTVVAALQKRHPGVFGFSVSHATRKPRDGEVDGQHYNFVAVEEFERLIEEGAFLEHAKVHSNYYGTSLAAIDNVVQQGQICILDIDVQGARSARKAGLQGTYIFMTPPSMEELERRLRGRGTETEESLERRLATTTFEMAATDEVVGGRNLFDSVICNDVVEETVETIEGLVRPFLEQFEANKAAEKPTEQANPKEAASAKASGGATKTAETKHYSNNVSIGWMATNSLQLEKGEQCFLSATLAGGAKMGIKLIFKRAAATTAHLLCKATNVSAVAAFFEPSEAGELILEFDNTKASLLSFSKSAKVSAAVSASPRQMEHEALVNKIQIQDLLDRSPSDAPAVVTSLSSAHTFSERNAEMARAAYTDILAKIDTDTLDCRVFGVGAYNFKR